ncbi:hypothetical protein [Rhodanobacter lindaniclasticus]
MVFSPRRSVLPESHLAFERVDGQPLAFQPGQFLQVHFHYDDGTATKRSYSVGTVGDGSSPVQRIEIAELRRGRRRDEAARRTADRRGDRRQRPVRPLLPQDADTHPRYLLLATGTGVTPYRAMLPQSRSCWPAASAKWALYGAQRGRTALRRGVRGFAQSHPGFLFHGWILKPPWPVVAAAEALPEECSPVVVRPTLATNPR